MIDTEAAVASPARFVHSCPLNRLFTHSTRHEHSYLIALLNAIVNTGVVTAVLLPVHGTSTQYAPRIEQNRLVASDFL